MYSYSELVIIIVSLLLFLLYYYFDCFNVYCYKLFYIDLPIYIVMGFIIRIKFMIFSITQVLEKLLSNASALQFYVFLQTLQRFFFSFTFFYKRVNVCHYVQHARLTNPGKSFVMTSFRSIVIVQSFCPFLLDSRLGQ